MSPLSRAFLPRVSLSRAVTMPSTCPLSDVGAGSNVDVAAHPDLALDPAVRMHGAVVDELAFEDVARPHRELLPTVTFDFTVVDRSCTFCHRLLNVHALPPTWNLRLGSDQALKVSRLRLRFDDGSV